MNKDFPRLKKPNDTQFCNPAGSNGYLMYSDKLSFASVATGDGGVKRTQTNVNQDKANSITLSDLDLITIDDTSTVVLVKVNEIDSISNMYRICRNERFDDVKLHYVGDDNMSSGRVCITTEKPFSIAETVKVIIHGMNFDVNVKEISTWNTIIDNDLERSDSEGVQEDGDHSYNMEDNHNDVLDDLSSR
nr:RNA-directed DNA polymerase, eukaryota [Tanacetum cinerariifolium]